MRWGALTARHRRFLPRRRFTPQDYGHPPEAVYGYPSLVLSGGNAT